MTTPDHLPEEIPQTLVDRVYHICARPHHQEEAEAAQHKLEELRRKLVPFRYDFRRAEFRMPTIGGEW